MNTWLLLILSIIFIGLWCWYYIKGYMKTYSILDGFKEMGIIWYVLVIAVGSSLVMVLCGLKQA